MYTAFHEKVLAMQMFCDPVQVNLRGPSGTHMVYENWSLHVATVHMD